jgi:hypothetical protein
MIKKDVNEIWNDFWNGDRKGIPVFVIEPPELKDITYENGDKDYETISGEYIRLEKVAADYLDAILKKGYMGWGYMPELSKLKKDGKITEDEYIKMIKILD